MATQTNNYNLKKPGVDDFYNIQDQNDNMEIIDGVLKGLEDNKEGLIKDAAVKGTIVDSDTIPFSDSAAGGIKKKITFLALKTALQAFFDTLYNYYVHPSGSGNNHIPSGGAAGQFLKWAAAGTAAWATLTKSDVGLSNVDNTSDANKAVSTATQTALNAKANLASPALTGTPTIAGNIAYHAGNITISTAAPGSALAEGYQHQVY